MTTSNQVALYRVKPYEGSLQHWKLILYSHLPYSEETRGVSGKTKKQKSNSRTTKIYVNSVWHTADICAMFHLVRLYRGSELGSSIDCICAQLFLDPKQLVVLSKTFRSAWSSSLDLAC